MARVEGLNLRGSRWCVRIIIPKDLRSIYNKDRVNPSLGTTDRREAVLAATLKRAEWLGAFAALRSGRGAGAHAVTQVGQGKGVAPKGLGGAVEAPASPLAPTLKPKTLRDVFNAWKQSTGGRDRPRSLDSIQAAERALRRFERKHPGVSLDAITRAMGDGFRTALIAETRTSKTARDLFIYVRALFVYAADVLEWIPRNPWHGLDIQSRITKQRRAMTRAEIEALFSTPLHTAYALPKSVQAGQDAAYWIPLLGLYTGARLGELCKLRPEDVLTVEAIPALRLTNEAEGAGTKTAAGNRIIPIHSELIRLGFLAYAQAMCKAGHASLWPAMPKREAKPGDYFGRWFREFSAGIEPTFHYFRHTVRPLMRQAGFEPLIRDRVTGHETRGSVGDMVYDSVLVGELRPAIESISYPFLSLPVVCPCLPLPLGAASL